MQVSTDARCVVQGVPGFVPRVLRDAEVGLFRAEDRVFDAMLDGWKAQMLARGLTAQTIEGRCRVLRRFQEYAGTFPWTWRPVDLDDYMAERRSGEKPISLTTLRSDSNAIAMFCAYTSSPTYGWCDFCEQTFGDVPAQIAFDWNTPRHTSDDAVPPGRRAFTQKELQKLFDYLDDLVDREYAAGSKRWLPALRDSIAFKVCYAYGLRRPRGHHARPARLRSEPSRARVRRVRRGDDPVGKRNRRIGAPTPLRADGSRVRVGRGPPQVLDPRRRPRPVPHGRPLSRIVAQRTGRSDHAGQPR
jgi:hypothetical protein